MMKDEQDNIIPDTIPSLGRIHAKQEEEESDNNKDDTDEGNEDDDSIPRQTRSVTRPIKKEEPDSPENSMIPSTSVERRIKQEEPDSPDDSIPSTGQALSVESQIKQEETDSPDNSITSTGQALSVELRIKQEEPDSSDDSIASTGQTQSVEMRIKQEEFDSPVGESRENGSDSDKNPTWDEQFRLLQQYKAIHGNVNVPKSHPTLGHWVWLQQKLYRENRLNAYREKRLSQIKLCRVNMKKWKIERKGWMNRYKRLVSHKESIKGSVNLESLAKAGLIRWVKKQRRMYRQGNIPRKERDLLDSIGIDWTKFDAELQSRLKQKRAKGQAIDGNNAASLVAESNNESGENSSDSDKNPTWDEQFQLLQQYKVIHGTVRVFRSHPTLGHWAWLQRKLYREKCLPEHHFKKLNGVGFEFHHDFMTKKERKVWLRKFKKLISNKGSVNLESLVKSGLSRGTRVICRMYHQGNLPREERDLLNTVGIDWTKLDAELYAKWKPGKGQALDGNNAASLVAESNNGSRPKSNTTPTKLPLPKTESAPP